MPREVCPHCEKEVELPYGKNIPCPNCGKNVSVFDDDHPLERKSVDSAYHIGSLAEYAPRRRELHEGQAGNSAPASGITYQDIGALGNIIAELDLLVNGSRKFPELWKHLGRKQIRGVLLSGPPGCGKTLVAQAVANETQRKVCLIQGSEIKGWRQGASEGNLISAYQSVRPKGILIIDEIDAIGGKREQMVNETNVSIVGTLCSLLDGAKYKDDVVIIATTNKPHTLDNALRRPGRFDVEMQVFPPDAKGREEIFEIHTKSMPLAHDVDLQSLAKRAHGFSGADIAGACASINQRLLKRAVEKIQTGTAQKQIIENLVITQDEFYQVIDDTIPSLLRENYLEVSKIHWKDIGGLDEIKSELQQVVMWPLQYKDEMQKLKLRQPKGLLLYGPPGCGKTMIAKAMARESECNFLAINGPALISKWIGSTEEAIRDLFWKARMAKPCIIFFDEIEAIAPVRGRSAGNEVTDRAVSQLLAEIDGVSAIHGIFVMAATNRADLVDPALLRPGRLDLQFTVPLPDKTARKKIFEIHLREVPLKNINIDWLVELTDGFSGADIEWTCTVAKKRVLEKYIASRTKTKKNMIVTQDELMSAIQENNKRKH
ncbi:MAG: AAA family ATPase [Patescibacteria group bacterium]